MTDGELLKQEQELHKEGEEVLKKLNIIQLLSGFGTPKTVGSFDSGLMTWRDIDIELEKDVIDEEFWNTVNKLFYSSGLKYLTIINFKNSKNPMTPKGLYIGIKYWLNDKVWKVDVWFMPQRLPDAENNNEWIKDNLNNENRKIILKIKNEVHNNDKYRKEFYSIDIYKAVIDENVKDLEGFKKYLKQTNRFLD